MAKRIVIAGAGSIGCFVGGLLAAAGRSVVLLARPRIANEVAAHGLTLTSFEGWKRHVPPAALRVTTDAADAFADASVVLVTVKSRDTAAMGRLIADHAPAATSVVSLQNGLSNADTLRAALPGRQVLAATVPFNVLQLGAGRFHKGTSGDILVDPDARVLAALNVPRLAVRGHPDMPAVLAGKLLLTLNNALNALSGLTLYRQLGHRGWRRLLADCQAEALAVFRARGIAPWSMGPLPAHLLPRILRLPTPLFRLLARSAVRIDRAARSSMWEDLERGRATEIDELQGKIVELAADLNLPAPTCRVVQEAVLSATRMGGGSPRLSPATLARAARP